MRFAVVPESLAHSTSIFVCVGILYLALAPFIRPRTWTKEGNSMGLGGFVCNMGKNNYEWHLTVYLVSPIYFSFMTQHIQF